MCRCRWEFSVGEYMCKPEGNLECCYWDTALNLSTLILGQGPSLTCPLPSSKPEISTSPELALQAHTSITGIMWFLNIELRFACLQSNHFTTLEPKVSHCFSPHSCFNYKDILFKPHYGRDTILCWRLYLLFFLNIRKTAFYCLLASRQYHMSHSGRWNVLRKDTSDSTNTLESPLEWWCYYATPHTFWFQLTLLTLIKMHFRHILQHAFDWVPCSYFTNLTKCYIPMACYPYLQPDEVSHYVKLKFYLLKRKIDFSSLKKNYI